jgi:hypothetical protein
MIEAIGEVSAQQTTRGDQQAVAAAQEKASREIDRAAVQRPVEETSDSQKAKADDQGDTRYNLEHKFPVYEKYGRDGELILQVPPVHDDEV